LTSSRPEDRGFTAHIIKINADATIRIMPPAVIDAE